MMNKKEVWISDDIFDWSPFIECGSYTSSDDLTRAYELWKHAEFLISNNQSELYLVDAISTLKRCLNQRLKFLENIYGLKHIALSNSPKGYLEYLEAFNLVRPFMLKKLMFIRNNIEHNDTNPPDVERCKELLDLCWYFLKSTDQILHVRRETIVFQDINDKGDETQYSCSLNIDFELNHKINISGWFPSYFISDEERSNHSKILLKEINTKAKWIGTNYHNNKLSSDIWAIGELLITNKMKHSIFKTLLNIY